MTPEKAVNIVRNKLGGYKIEYCIPYGNQYIVMAHPDNGPEDEKHGFYPDPFYAVNKLTGAIRHFIPAAERDHGASFFDAVESLLQQKAN